MRIVEICALSALVFAVGCDDDGSSGGAPADATVAQPDEGAGGAQADAGAPDAEPADGALPDGEIPDGDLPDAELPDGELPDAEIPDGEIPDGDLPDAEIPDADLPDGEIPDGDLPDGDLPDAEIPDGGMPDAEPPDPEAVIGQVQLEILQPDALFDWPEVFVHGLFVPILAALDLDNAVGWVDYTYGTQAYIAEGYWRMPEIGAPALAEAPGAGGPLRGLDAGYFVGFGPTLVAPLDPFTSDRARVPVYASLLEDGATLADGVVAGEVLPLQISGGEDIARAWVPDAVVVPEAIEITSHDASLPLPMRYGEALTFTWIPSPSPDDVMLVSLLNTEDGDGVIVQIPDEVGEVSLDTTLDFFEIRPGETPTLSFARTRRHDVPLPEGRIRVVESTRLFLYGETVKPVEMRPEILVAGQLTKISLRWWDGEFDLEAAALSLGEGVRLENVEVADTQGHVITADAVVALDAPTGPVHLSGGGLPGASGRLGFLAATLPSAGDCRSAFDEGQMPDGTYLSSYTGLAPIGFDGGATCGFGDPEAGEQIIPLHLEAGQTLNAELVTKAFGTLYLARDCDGNEQPFECVYREATNGPVNLSYTAELDEDLLLVVDAYSINGEQPGGASAPFVVDIRRTAPAPLVVLPRAVTDDGEETLEIIASRGEFDLVEPNFDLGADVQILSVAVDEFDPWFATLEVAVGDVSAPTAVTVSATLDGGERVQAEAAFDIEPWMGTIPSCEIANFIDPLTVDGGYVGSTDFGDRELDPSVICPNGASGPESVIAVALGAGETLRARVLMEEGDAVVYVLGECDAQPLTCADAGGSGAAEYLEWTGPAAPSVVYLVVDGFDVGDFGVFTLQLEVAP